MVQLSRQDPGSLQKILYEEGASVFVFVCGCVWGWGGGLVFSEASVSETSGSNQTFIFSFVA